jgi:hypothetical protein
MLGRVAIKLVQRVIHRAFKWHQFMLFNNGLSLFADAYLVCR